MSDNKTPYPADQYEKNIIKTVPYYEQFYQETIDLVKTSRPDASIWLDTGCGAGSLIARAYPFFPDTEFVLADPSKNMLAQADQNLRLSAPNARITFIPPIGTENIVFPGPRSPEVITAIQSHHYLDQEGRKKATKNCYELLNADGLYITFENIYPRTEAGKDLGLKRWGAYQATMGKDEKSVNEHLARFNRSYFPIRVDEHLALLEKCGFRTVEIFWLSYLQAGFYAIK